MTSNMDAPPQTVLPYGPGNRWTFKYKQSRFEQTHELALIAEPTGAAITDDYDPDETSAQELWKLWARQQADRMHKEWPELYRSGEVHINWGVTCPDRTTISEHAPHARPWPNPRRSDMNPTQKAAYDMLYGGDPDAYREDFLTHYTHPVHAVTGERINWLRLPVIDLGWNTSASDRGGFIQEATGWKPSPLQPTMDVRQIGAAAGLYVPPL
ncbi:hypothetical protein ACFC5Z_40075 [Streptomyces sp. NPDC056004]|uniref:hypothetical protein n=1 Tax=Streptomyces sp. NPDC056004 TaxID=3345677 RepID=UPI0035E15575